MKTFLKRATALLLSAVLLCPVALASEAMGSRIYSYTLDICDNTTLSKEVMWSASRSDLRTENYVTYTPSPSVSPKVSFGTNVLAKQSVLNMAKSLERGGDRVLSGINGDYFVMATGNPLGLVVTDGLLRSSSAYLNAIGFRKDGTALIGKPELTLRADIGGQALQIANINKIRDGNTFYLFTDDFGATTKNTKAGVDIILSPIQTPEGQPVTGKSGNPLTTANDLKIGGLTACQVEEVIEAQGATPIPEGKYVLSVIGTGAEYFLEEARALQPGDRVDLEIYCADTRWNQVDCAVGAMYWILAGGQVQQVTDNQTAPRTAVGVKANGDVIFYTMDGRRSGHSVGATIQMVAQRLQELGCVDAVLLDGGGSTTMVSTYPDYDSSTTVNKPSEGSARAVTNAIFLVSNLDPTGRAGSLYVTPDKLTLLAGGTAQCAATAVDTGWYPMDTLPGAITWSADGGTVSDSGLFTAPAKTGTYAVTATAGGVTGSTKIQVYDTPTAITLTNAATGKRVSSLTLSPGQKVDLNAAANYRTIDLAGSDHCFTWSADPTLGTIDENGVFVAGTTTASGRITIQAGGHTASIPVTVAAPAEYTLAADFEGGGTWFDSRDAKLSLNDTSATVLYGKQSLQVAYTLNSDRSILTASKALTEKDRYLALWVYGDNSGNRLTADFTNAAGEALSQDLTTLSFTGWKQVAAAIPDGAVSLEGLSITGSQAKGTLWLDQVVLSNQRDWDHTAPKTKLSVSGTAVSATLTDNARSGVKAEQVSLALDGDPIPFTYSGSTLTATLPDLIPGLHQVTVTAADPCGNLVRSSATVSTAAAPNPFADMTDHWAGAYTGRLSQLGIITGMSDGTRMVFRPNLSITRGDFALMVARWMELDLENYAHVTLPYADLAAIPAWDLNGVKALYALGIMEGSTNGDGNIYSNARASITRAEAMTILGRIQAKGFGEADLSQFTDAGAVPSWARGHLATLVGLDVVGGSNGQLRPNDTVTRAEVAKMLFTLW